VHLEGSVRPLVRLVVPVLFEQALALGVGFTDKWLCGRLLEGPEYLAAVGLVAYCIGFMPALFAIAGVPATALVARAVGAGDARTARRATAQALLVGAVVAAVILAAAALGGGRFVRMLGLPSQSSALAIRYLAIVVPALPLMMFTQVGVAALRGAGSMRSGLGVMTVVNLVNASASAALATGFAGLPRLGWSGLAWGTLLGSVAGSAVTMILLFRHGSGLAPRWFDWLPSLAWRRRIVAIGTPAGLDGIANAVCQLWFLSIVNRLGDTAAAAHALGITIESIAFLPGAAFMVAASTLAGQFLGAGDQRRARESVRLAAIACTLLMSAVAVVLYAEAAGFARLFLGRDRQPEVVSQTAELVRIVAFAQPPLALLMVFAGALRGAGQTRLPMAVNLVSLCGVRLPLAMFLGWDGVVLPGGLGSLPAAGLGVRGAWYAMAADLFLRGLAMTMLFRWSNWTRPVR